MPFRSMHAQHNFSKEKEKTECKKVERYKLPSPQVISTEDRNPPTQHAYDTGINVIFLPENMKQSDGSRMEIFYTILQYT
jgi:hypothetical protein